MPEAPVAVAPPPIAQPSVIIEQEQTINPVKTELCSFQYEKAKDGVLLKLKSPMFHAFFKGLSNEIHEGSISRKQLYKSPTDDMKTFTIGDTWYKLDGENAYLIKDETYSSGRRWVNMAVLRAVTLDKGVEFTMTGLNTDDNLAKWSKLFQAGCLHIYITYMRPVAGKCTINITNEQPL